MPPAAALPLIVALAQVLPAPGVEYFPGPYFASVAQDGLEGTALTTWPGPDGLMTLWRSGGLAEEERVALLLGGAAFHDPGLLPAYREGALSPSPRLRAAAAVGYRAWLGDPVSTGAAEVDRAAAVALAREVDAVAATLRRHSLVEVWLAALLDNEGSRLPGWSGVVLKRPLPLCSRALDRLLEVEDLELLAGAFQVAQAPQHRQLLVSFAEGLALETFAVRLRDPRQGAITVSPEGSVERMSAWLEAQCTSDASRGRRARLRAFGRGGVAGAWGDCDAWQQVLRRGEAWWWPTAARELYRCGGPPVAMSFLRTTAEQGRAQREQLLTWFRTLAHAGGARPPRARAP